YTVRPLESGSYTLTASNAEGKQVQQTLAVTVLQPRIAAFTSDVPAVKAGDPDRLAWRVEGANDGTRISITPDVGEVDARRMRPLNPFQTTTYTLTVTAADGTQLPPATVTVRAIPTLVQFQASSQTISPGDTVTLFWSVQAAAQIGITTSDGRALHVDPSAN